MISKFVIKGTTYVVYLDEKQIDKIYNLIAEDIINPESITQLGYDLLIAGKLDLAISFVLVEEGFQFNEASAKEIEKVVSALTDLEKFIITAEVLNQLMSAYGLTPESLGFPSIKNQMN